MSQFIAARFRPNDVRDYAYRNDGEPVAVGDFVKVESRAGFSIVEVTSLLDEKPPFECKQIVEKVERPESWLAPTKGITDGQ